MQHRVILCALLLIVPFRSEGFAQVNKFEEGPILAILGTGCVKARAIPLG
ncbi:MAG: hypothetical protein ACI814_003467 [Mariniblastus sp.]|jgi:hypothetical protein